MRPNAGATIGNGTTSTIAWTASDNIGVDHVDLYYSLNGGTTYSPIAANQPNSGTYDWLVPSIATNHTARVKVVAFDVSGYNSADASDADFTIEDASAPLVHLDSPNGGEAIDEGTTTKISWTASDDVGVDHVDLYYSVDGGSNYKTIVEFHANNGSYDWTVPATPTTRGRVKVVAVDATGNGTEDVSDADFTIIDASVPVVTVIRPNGGETLDNQTTITLEFGVSDNVGVHH